MNTQSPYSAALVTGAAQRIGRTIALSLAQKGLAVAIHHRSSDEDAADLVAHIQNSGGRACSVKGDLSEGNVASGLVAKASDTLGTTIDVLINNASVFEKDDLKSLTQASWDLHQNVNLRAPVILTQCLARQLPRGKSGCVVNIVDQRVLKLNPQYFSYTAAKAGLWTTTRTMAQSLAPLIRVNAISPGPTLANQYQADGDFEKESKNVMLGRGPALEEIAAAVKFLLETPSITGQMIALDGGQHLAWQTPDILEE